MSRINDLKIYADSYPATRFPYWHVSASSNITNGSFMLMSDNNSSHYDSEFTGYVKAMICEIFNNEEHGLEPMKNVIIKFMHKSFGKQSSMRYKNPKDEGYVKVTIESEGIKGERGFRRLKKFDLKFFIIGHLSESDFENTAKSMLTPKALIAWNERF